MLSLVSIYIKRERIIVTIVGMMVLIFIVTIVLVGARVALKQANFSILIRLGLVATQLGGVHWKWCFAFGREGGFSRL